MNAQIKDYYQVLDLEPCADLASIRQSYRQLVKVWHPDRFGTDKKLQAMANDKLKKSTLRMNHWLHSLKVEERLKHLRLQKQKLLREPQNCHRLKKFIGLASIDTTPEIIRVRNIFFYRRRA